MREDGILTGSCKKAFDDWLSKPNQGNLSVVYYSLPECAKLAIIQDWMQSIAGSNDYTIATIQIKALLMEANNKYNSLGL